MKIIPFEELSTANLYVDAIYEGGSNGNASDDPLAVLLPGAGNQGGFRQIKKGKATQIAVLYSSGQDPDWPDHLDEATGRYTYYGDNKKPGCELHNTPKQGNLLLRDCFDLLHSQPEDKRGIPIFLVFEKQPTPKSSRAVQFKGVAVPGFEGIPQTEDLLAVWKSTNKQRFQNYRATFTILDIANLTRDFISQASNGEINQSKAPAPLSLWWNKNLYRPLQSQRTISIRSREEQSPEGKSKQRMLNAIYDYYKKDPISFEHFAAEIYRLSDSSNVIIDEVTRGTIDGGRDAIGRYKLGPYSDPIYVDFALEAKCYRPANHQDGKTISVGVRETSRLISRIRNRQFGVLVTTSVVDKQAYTEIRSDKHPIIFITGADIVAILTKEGISTPEAVNKWLVQHFPI